MSFGRALLVTGPSGVGKGTLVSMLLRHHPNKFDLSVSHTTRRSRPGEVHGKHYYFVNDPKEMWGAIRSGEFVEHSAALGNVYGTSKTELARLASLGKTAVLDVDLHGLDAFRRVPGLQVKAVGVVPDTMDALRARLAFRNTESPQQVAERLARAEKEIARLRGPDANVDALIENVDSWAVGYPALEKLLYEWGMLP